MKETALFIASKYGHVKIINELLKRGADIRTTDFLGRTCDLIALRNNNNEAVHLLNTWLFYNN